MKKMFILSILFIFSSMQTFAQVEDNSIIEELNKDDLEEISQEEISFKTFESCEEMTEVTSNFLKTYNGKYPWYNGRDFMYSINSSAITEEKISFDSDSAVSEKTHSETNEQVSWVSESEIVKTDWKYIYYISEFYDKEEKEYADRNKKSIYVVDSEWMNVVKKINLPSHFYGTQIYLENDKLIILATWNPTWDFQKAFWDNSSKTYTIIYDVENPEEAKMLKAYMTEWNYSKSRLIGDKLYVISEKNNYSLFRAYWDDSKISAEDIIPKSLEITYPSDSENLEETVKISDYNVVSGNVAECNDIEYILPETDTDLGYPNFNIISTIDINDMDEDIKTKVVFWNLNEIYMSLDSLYMTNSVYKTNAYRCPANAYCIMPFYYGGTNNTLVHKMDIVWDELEYSASTLLEWSPLTQYSMDEKDWDFRILTKTSRWDWKAQDAHTDLYILDDNLELKSTLGNLWAWEDFKSSRFIWDKLFLVTFKQIDPLFIIDLEDSKNPKILGELKMPGYSTYLHPYDENHVIGLGYDTAENNWWGTINSWIKVDLYEIDYDKKPENKDNTWDIYVAQKYTKTFGWYWSTSEALTNPRMFQWNSETWDLFLPATLKETDPEDMYRSIDYFQGLISLNVNKDNWIEENYRITHINTENLEEERVAECEEYVAPVEEECYTLIWWGEFCQNTKHVYVPKYCYEKSPIWEYLSSKSWNYSTSFINRAIWINDNIYTISDKQIQKSDISTGEFEDKLDLK